MQRTVHPSRPAAVPALAMSGAVALAVLVLALLLTRGTAGDSALPDAGAVTGWAAPVLRLLQHAAAVATVGALLAGLLAQRDSAAAGRVAPVATAASAWAVLSLASVVVGLSEVAGQPLREVLDVELLRAYVERIAAGRALVWTALLALAVAVAAPLARLPWGRAGLLVLALGALVPPLRTGHAATAADHTLAVAATSVHVVAVVLWVGGLVALVAERRTALPVAVPRFSALALVCFCAVALSGSVAAWTRLDGFGALVTTGYGALLLAKAAVLVALGAAGWQHRRRTVAQVVEGDSRAFWRLAGAEVGLMAVALALAVALTRTAAG